METSNSKNRTIKIIVLIAVIFLTGYVAVNATVNTRLAKLQNEIDKQMTEQRAVIASLIDDTTSNKVVKTGNIIIRDCTLTERVEYESLMSRLNDGLSQSDLTELDNLLGRCGSYQHEQKLLLLAKLEREIDIYENQLDQMVTVVGNQEVVNDYDLALLRDYINSEKDKAGLAGELVKKQDGIIKALRAGNAPNSPEINTILQEVTEIKETLNVMNLQTEGLREQLKTM
ncbi:hypothetical protein KC851_01715 [Candidatus Kaiserbacteria bacterium]|nr:hypothetical protein [Candidatus Kaiserbacteria bacterium]